MNRFWLLAASLASTTASPRSRWRLRQRRPQLPEHATSSSGTGRGQRWRGRGGAGRQRRVREQRRAVGGAGPGGAWQGGSGRAARVRAARVRAAPARVAAAAAAPRRATPWAAPARLPPRPCKRRLLDCAGEPACLPSSSAWRCARRETWPAGRSATRRTERQSPGGAARRCGADRCRSDCPITLDLVPARSASNQVRDADDTPASQPRVLRDPGLRVAVRAQRSWAARRVLGLHPFGGRERGRFTCVDASCPACQ